ncbi:MAG: carbohydrate ABC transporter permease [Ruminococcus sp.]|nr:carbohydrate ABC transporter permease [Ruminococcus sp.]
MIRNKKTEAVKTVLTYVFLTVMVVISVFPIVWMLDSSLKGSSEIYSSPPTFTIHEVTMENYVRVLFDSGIPRAFLNSVIVSVTATLTTLTLGCLAGYGFSRYRFKGRRMLYVGLLYGQMMPAVVLIIPVYLVFSKIGLIDSYFSLILPDVAITVPLATLMLKSFFDGVPVELEDAARIDGASKLGILWKIIIPIAKPGLVSVAIYTFLSTWEEFIFALNLTNSSSIRTLPIAINMFKGEFIIDWGAIMSSGAVISLPVILLFVLCNKAFVKGLSEGGVKG